MDPELHAVLQAMEQRLTGRLDAMAAEIVAVRLQAQAAHEEARAAHEEAQAAHEEARAAHEEARAAHEEAKAAHEEAKAAHEVAQAAHEEAKAAHEEARAARAVGEAAAQLADRAMRTVEDRHREILVLLEDHGRSLRTVAEGLVGLRESAARQGAEYQESLMNRHIAPLEAMAADHEKRLTALEARAK